MADSHSRSPQHSSLTSTRSCSNVSSESPGRRFKERQPDMCCVLRVVMDRVIVPTTVAWDQLALRREPVARYNVRYGKETFLLMRRMYSGGRPLSIIVVTECIRPMHGRAGLEGSGHRGGWLRAGRRVRAEPLCTRLDGTAQPATSRPHTTTRRRLQRTSPRRRRAAPGTAAAVPSTVQGLRAVGCTSRAIAWAFHCLAIVADICILQLTYA